MSSLCKYLLHNVFVSDLASSSTKLNVAPRHSNVSTQQLTLKTWKRSGTTGSSPTVRQMIRVTPMPAVGSANTSHPRSILLPLQDLKDVRTIKIVNAKNATNNRASKCITIYSN